LARAMLGRELSGQRDAAAVGVEPVEIAEAAPDEHRPNAADGAPVLSLAGVVTLGPDRRRVLDGLTLAARRGEIVGIAGVEGNGQTGLVELFSGLSTVAEGDVTVAGVVLTDDRRALSNVGVIPADRHGSGCILSMSVMDNLFLGRLGPVTVAGLLRSRLMMAETEAVLADYGITASGPRAPMWSLSGGNQQRLVLARELLRRPSVLVAEQPTRGLDVGAMEDMWLRLRQVAAAGTAVLLISTELDEILAVSDRVVVLRKGTIVGEMSRDELDIQKLGLLMGGQAA
jgi:general nucleoside transport system ATP-binding protein